MTTLANEGRTEKEVQDIRFLQAGTTFNIVERDLEKKEWHVSLSNCNSIIHCVQLRTNGKISIEILNELCVLTGCHTDNLRQVRREIEKIIRSDARFRVSSTAKEIDNRVKSEIAKYEQICFSLHYGSNSKISYSFEAADAATCATWVRGINLLIKERKHAAKRNLCDPKYWLQRFFQEADQANTGTLDIDQCKNLLIGKLNIAMDENLLQKYFEEADTNKANNLTKPVLDEDEFFRFYQLVCQRKALDVLFYERVDLDGERISSIGLSDFLTKVQGEEDLDGNEVRRMINTYEDVKEPEHGKKMELSMTLNGFRAMMVSEEFDIRLKKHRRINQPMDRPLNHYWIKSSHNTYDLQDKKKGSCSIEGYRRALARNSACIELNLWDGENGNAIVCKGKPLEAVDVLRDGIAPFLFTHDAYPVILFIEDHMTADQRWKFIQDLRQIFGDSLYVCRPEGITCLPSPEELRRKVIVCTNHDNWDDFANILQLVNLPQNGIEAKDQPYNHVYNLSEHEAKQLMKENLFKRFFKSMVSPLLTKVLQRPLKTNVGVGKLRKWTARQLTRVYPKGYRLLTSDFDPIRFMNGGCQMVAINGQTKCISTAIYDGRFRANGDCGYVLKPDFLMDRKKARRLPPQRLSIKIISGQNIEQGKNFRPEADRYVTVRIVGEVLDSREMSTKPISGSGLNPVWGETLEFIVHTPELAIIIFVVNQLGDLKNHARRNETVGLFALPVTSLAIGYRHVPLQNTRMERLPLSTLFVKVAFEEVRDVQIIKTSKLIY